MVAKVEGFALLQRVVKGLAIAVGGVCSFVFFASLVGAVTGNGLARALVGLVLTVALPAFAVDRALPRKDAGKARPGLVSDVVALVLLGVGLLFIGVGQPVTRPLLVREGDRLAEDGHAVVAHAVYLLGGVRVVDAPVAAPAAPPAPPSAPPNASASGGP
ncbi:MAG TPA: hypothetical protein VIF15_12520 [Polyangiaceae bacterium]|jgi:hypothetical protein